MSDQRTKDWIELALVPKISLGAKLAWLKEFGTPQAVLNMTAGELKRVSSEGQVLKDLVEQKVIDDVISWTGQTDGRCVFLGDEDYPVRLLERLSDPPLVLFMRGDISCIETNVVGFCGTAQPSTLYRNLAKTFGYELSSNEVTATAGLSKGIATAALSGSISANGRCVGVIGDSSTWEGIRMCEQIAETGLLISEFAPRSPAVKLGYPRRHRLLGALCDLIVVVEAPHNCDSIKLASDVLDMGCQVAAVPSSPASESGRGCNMLIRDGAWLVERTKDVLAALKQL